ncbi:hypothetical protein IQ247_07685 [Plectonema cf. radiosum LEGE 06105]|uniref:Uncharacterized protein n=1 Tax=Plectonema cf. radiosum LEGE 06105 TaxID=945769 RepID=A0A8J7F0S3_9CYAN|nr:hypothetical protein [Plectonema radiosum]MBE9212597.1 hypothetical protein [Plectonema cf. radiosum LEGE 06105]
MLSTETGTSKYAKIFLVAICVLYFIVFLYLNKLQFSPIWDEPNFWQTSLIFSRSLIPPQTWLQDYQELNTPLPFIIFGFLEFLFKGGIFVGRLFNFFLSFLMTCIIGLPINKTRKNSFLALCGLISFPYYLWLSGHLYTDIIASFFVLIGFVFYIRCQHIFSGISFVLAIASRQYMLVFPLAITAYELFKYLKIKFINYQQGGKTQSHQKYKHQLIRILAPLTASFSIFGWFLLFKGIAPQAAITERSTPEVQLNWWSIELNSSLYFLACVGLYFVIPELILFRPKLRIKKILTRTNIFLAVVLLLLFIIFPPLEAHGILIKVAKILPNDFLRLTLFYFLALITCWRFFKRPNLAFWILLVNSGLMIKAYPWDKYLLPLLIVFWYFKSIEILDKNIIHKAKNMRV